MTNGKPATRRPPTPQEIGEQQKRDAERASAQKAAPTALMTQPPTGTAVAAPDTRTAVQRLIDEDAPATIVGRMIKFSKEGKYVTSDDGTTIADSAVFIALVDQMLAGRVKFNGPGEPPTRHMGLPFEGYVPPPREILGDTDRSTWEIGLDGQPADPWQDHRYMVLQHAETQELFTFVTSSKTGRRAVGNLVTHYTRLQRSHPDHYPLIKLTRGGFDHKDPRVGRVHTPNFAIAGRHPKDSTAKPDLSPEATFDDKIPF